MLHAKHIAEVIARPDDVVEVAHVTALRIDATDLFGGGADLGLVDG
jgi:hypothetical protein